MTRPDSPGPSRRIPVILDTDIGGDIDDTWALAFMLRCPELDIKLVTTDTGDTTYRAKIVAKLLEVAGRADVPVGVGRPVVEAPSTQEPWVESYDLAGYPGPVHDDGVGILVETIMDSSEPITLLCIGPVPNVQAALEREPRIAERARFVGMHGSVRKGYGGSEAAAAEYNVVSAPEACRAAFAAPWDVTITPLDTCGIVQLEGERYQAVRDCEDPLVQAVIENYRVWIDNCRWGQAFNPETESSILFDTVAVYLAFSEEFLVMEELGLQVTDSGLTTVDEDAKKVRAAMDWVDLSAFKDLLVERLTLSAP
jgi:inosine-uridine nucleoside N-ribohydrolase